MNQPETKRKLFIWKRQHDSCLLREVLHLEPYNQKQSDRGRVWRVIAENLNTNTQHDFKTTDRSCGDRFNKLMEEFEKKDQEEKKASGVDAESFENGA
ncbi:hypothetical protein ABFA07_010004 [Porites harrisoni]